MTKWIKVILLCTTVVPLHSFTQCGFTLLDVNLSACDPSDNSFEINGSIEFENPPTTGQLILEDCNGNQQLFNAPFTSPINYSITGIDSDGTLGCDLTAHFTDEAACNITSSQFDYPETCLCNTEAGTYSQSINGISTSTGPYSLCFGDELEIAGNGDFVASQEFNTLGVTYDPGVFLFVYDCPPTVFSPNDLNGDTCLVGIASSNDQAWEIVNNVGDSSTFWYAPVTMYSMVDSIYAISINGGDWCFDMGPIYEVTYLEEYVMSIDPIMDDTVCAFEGPISLTATDTSGIWSSSCSACLDSNGVFYTEMANIGSNTIYYTVSDSVCTYQDSLTIFVDQCGSISQNKKELVSIYPNPIEHGGIITVETGNVKNAELQFFDTQGRKITSVPISDVKSIYSIEQPFATGIYTVHLLKAGEIIQVEKIVVK